MPKSEEAQIPVHIGLIMDGNGRWARRRLLPRSAGHSEGMKRMVGLAEKAYDMGVKYLTVYALSTENLSRPKEELDKLFSLITDYFTGYVKKLIARGACVKVIGDLSLLPDYACEAIEEGLALSPKEAEFTFTVAVAYGARAEIVRAAKLAAAAGKDVTEEQFASYLYTDGTPDPDLIIRTGGEVRLSNYLLYQAAYAELYFTDVLFPDFSDRELEKAVKEYGRRTRRFGKI